MSFQKRNQAYHHKTETASKPVPSATETNWGMNYKCQVGVFDIIFYPPQIRRKNPLLPYWISKNEILFIWGQSPTSFPSIWFSMHAGGANENSISKFMTNQAIRYVVTPTSHGFVLYESIVSPRSMYILHNMKKGDKRKQVLEEMRLAWQFHFFTYSNRTTKKNRNKLSTLKITTTWKSNFP